ncbi:MAG: hypothetical protein WCA29_07525 [Jiangellales bacterium]
MSRQDEAQAAGALAGDALAGVIGIVEDVHRAVSGRVDSYIPAAATPVAVTRRAFTDAVYVAVVVGERLISAGVAEVVSRRGEQSDLITEHPVGQRMATIVNGLWGDKIAENHPAIALRTAVRVDGHDLLLDPETVAEAFPNAGPTMVVFVHGLVQGEEAWGPRPVVTIPGEPEPSADDGRPYGERLEKDLGLSPVYVRYNSGLRVSENGKRLSALLDDLVAAWPVPVEQIALVGASMGGLVARSASYYGDRDGSAWAAAVRTVVTLGTPHLGAPLEQGAHVVDIVLRKLPETEPFSRILGSRSLGVKDLRYGNLIEEDWFGHDPDELLTDRATHVPFLDHATYYFVAATVTSDSAHPAGHLLGDGLVRYSSASGNGKTRRIPFDHDKGFHLTGVHHLSMLNHPVVYTKLREWLAPLAGAEEAHEPA